MFLGLGQELPKLKAFKVCRASRDTPRKSGPILGDANPGDGAGERGLGLASGEGGVKGRGAAGM